MADLLIRRHRTGNDLQIGRTFVNDRLAQVNARTRTRSSIRIGHHRFVTASAKTSGARGIGRIDYDPNLLSAVHRLSEQRWQRAETRINGYREPIQSAQSALVWRPDHWREADALPASTVPYWRPALTLWGSGSERWRDADPIRGNTQSAWQQAGFVPTRVSTDWQEGFRETTATTSRFRVRLPLLTVDRSTIWRDSSVVTLAYAEGFSEGRRLDRGLIEVWQQGAMVWNEPRLPPVILPPLPYRWDGRLDLVCDPSSTNRLVIGGRRCPIMGQRRIHVRRTYTVLNTASLTLLDGTPLPCTSMTIKTDANSWCWGLSASLSGPDAWALVQPSLAGYPVEVRATVNDWVWDFVLDYPGLNRGFNISNLTVEGRSRSAWLDEPWTPRTIGTQSQTRTAQQLAEDALDNTGWTLDWRLEDWLVPGGRFEWDNSLIGRLIRLVKPVEGCVYTDPHQQVITVYPRYATASWLWDGLTPDLELPEAALKSWSRKPNLTPAYNGVYVSGTSHGVLAFVKIAGTDGATQPGQPIVEALCCDEDGIAARQRGLAFLSANGGSGFTLSGQALLGRYGQQGNNPGLLTPLDSIRLGSQNGWVRSVSVNASRSGGATGVLNVSQTAEVECWEVEA